MADIDLDPLQPQLETVMAQDEPIVLQEPRLRELLPHLGYLMVLPFVIEKEVMGTLTAAIHHPAPALTDLGIPRLSTFAEFASLTLDNHFKYAGLIKKGEAEHQAYSHRYSLISSTMSSTASSG